MKGRGVGRRSWMLASLASLLLLAAVTTAGWTDESMDDPGDPDRAIGVIGAAICGGEGWLIRVNPLLGMNPYVLAAGIGGCLLLGLDMIT
jgi:hypothetical protein